MSSEKNPEVVACDASIMKDVWEIRLREQEQKKQMEEERIQKSALPSINQDWANRVTARTGNFRRVERKTKPVDTQIDDNNVWKSKQPMVTPVFPRGAGSGSLARLGVQSRGFSTPAQNHKNKKGQDKYFNKLQVLMFITQTQPSAMVWGKSWKYNKSLPSPAEGITTKSDWGQCWMFATQQPNSEAGKPWPNGPNIVDPHRLPLWKKPDYRLMESQELQASLPAEKWQMSWRKSSKNNTKDTSSMNGDNVSRSGYFTLLLETQHPNKALCLPEWNDSWRSAKSVTNKQEKLVNHVECNKSQLNHWANSWRTVVINNHKNSDHSDTYDDCIQQKKSHLPKIMLASNDHKYIDLYLQLCNEFKAHSEWIMSWQMTKNNSKPCEEMEKVLKDFQPLMEAQKMEEKPKEYYSTSEIADPHYEQLKQSIIYQSRREFTQLKLHSLKSVENFSFPSNWTDSWQTLKHRMRMERRRMRPDPSRPFRESETGAEMKSAEWKDSWKFTSQPLRQEPELWQRAWPTTPQIRVDRARNQNHFAPVELPKNGPTAERSWGESWRFSRRHHRSQPLRGNPQTSQGRSNVVGQHPNNSRAQRRSAGSASDWQESWMVSESQFHHDKPSLLQWREAWKCSAFHTENWTEQVTRDNSVFEEMEIQPMKKKISLQRAEAKMSWTIDNQMFRERYPEKQWSTSWRAGSLLNHQPSHYGSSGIPGKNIGNTTQHGSMWGKSFRLANPMPQVEKPWLESPPNLCHYTVMWSRGKTIKNKIYTNLNSNPANLRLWQGSYQLLQGANVVIQHKSKSKALADPRVILSNKIKTRSNLYSKIEKEKQSKRQCAGCHLLGKTQPRPTRRPASVKTLKMKDESKEKFFEDWAESWRSLDEPGGPKKRMPMTSLSGWAESWKFLLPTYQPVNGPKAM
ncbi:uncharacterized protein LOC124849745 [Scophthalmus maximus]|uniref:uncharacterized protein LOC124849745 n=1 Tax=Scophthalmus maximus TaxID=52904 RepID=UPI001FA92CF4|nr:uncharacterized protein LOC124849745 [Scophthalmus maximus]